MLFTLRDLTGDWAIFARIAGPFTIKLPAGDREDWLHNTMLEMAKVRAKYEKMGKRLTEAGLMKVAGYEFKGYWDRRRYALYVVNCTHCSSDQRYSWMETVADMSWAALSPT